MDTGFLIALVLIVLVCPISMWLMMRGQGRSHGDSQQNRSRGDASDQERQSR